AQQYSFSFTPFLQKTYQHSLASDRPICKAYASGSCPLKGKCPDRHVAPSIPPSSANNANSYQPSGGFGSLVCKHWLRGLCKKGEGCEFLHEYNLRKMPECNFFVRNGFCSNGDECLYLHIDPQSKLPPCPHYDRGFCPLGPRCDKKHVRRAQLCAYYLAGFCPFGRACKEGAHPRWTADKDMERPHARDDTAKATAEEAAATAAATAAAAADASAEMGGGGGDEHGQYQYNNNQQQQYQQGMQDRGDNMHDGGRGNSGAANAGRDRDGSGGSGHERGGHKDRFGNRGGRWRGKGGRFRGRGG
ncbi:hypothetical protein B0T26DRAFT_616859, partial [Lasiosphaeria miniovina]